MHPLGMCYITFDTNKLFIFALQWRNGLCITLKFARLDNYIFSSCRVFISNIQSWVSELGGGGDMPWFISTMLCKLYLPHYYLPPRFSDLPTALDCHDIPGLRFHWFKRKAKFTSFYRYRKMHLLWLQEVAWLQLENNSIIDSK